MLRCQPKTEPSSSLIPFVLTYDAELPKVKKIFNKHWPIIESSKRLNKIFPQKPTKAYRRPKSVSVKLRRQTNCKSANAIYLITCTQCGKQYNGETKHTLNERMNGHRSDWKKRRFQRSPVAEHFHLQNHAFNSHVSLCCIEHDAQWSDDTRKARDSYWIRRLNTIQPEGINKDDSDEKWLIYGRLRIISEGWAGSSENTMKLYTIDDRTQVGPAVVVGAVCDCFYLLSLSIPYLSVRVCVCVFIPIPVTTFPEWLSGTEPLPHTHGAVCPSSLFLWCFACTCTVLPVWTPPPTFSDTAIADPILIPLFSSSELTGCGYPGLLDRKNRSNMCPRRESNPRLPACQASTLFTRPGSPRPIP